MTDKRMANKNKGPKFRYKRYMGKSVIAGAGVYMTSPRGKEFRAVAELIDILEDYAEKLYTPERLEELAAVHRPHVAVDDDDDEAAKPTETEQGAEEVVHVEASEEDEDEEESIEDAIKRELAELKQTTGGKRKRGKEDEGADGQSIKRVKRRFEKRDTDTQCLSYVLVRRPFDPVELVETIVKDLADGEPSRSRFIQRLSPVTQTCRANSLEAVQQSIDKAVKDAMDSYMQDNDFPSRITYQIEPQIRSHKEPLNRDVLIKMTGSAVRDYADGCSDLTVSADLKSPMLVVMPIVLQGTFSCGVVDGKLWSGAGAKYNIETVASKARQSQKNEDKPEEAKSGDAPDA